MNIEQAIKIVEQALNIASKSGAFELKDSAVISSALELIKKTQDDSPAQCDTNKEEKEIK